MVENLWAKLTFESHSAFDILWVYMLQLYFWDWTEDQCVSITRGIQVLLTLWYPFTELRGYVQFFMGNPF